MWILALLFACGPARQSDPSAGPDTGEGGVDSGGVDTAAGGVEDCNGVDDDGDGDVDEGFADADGNGRVDCLDGACADHVAAGAGAVAGRDVCEEPRAAIPDPWSVAVEMRFSSGGLGVGGMPAIGALRETSATRVGGVTGADIVFTTRGTNHLSAIAGDGSGQIFSVPGFDGDGGVALADVDGDGETEILAFTVDHRIAAVDASGVTRWTSDVLPLSAAPQITVADLDGDGVVEVIGDVGVVDGRDGSTRFVLGPVSATLRAPVVADLDQDGWQEILIGEDRYAADGVWLGDGVEGAIGAWSVVVDSDGDPRGEVWTVAETPSGVWVELRDDDGALLVSTPLAGEGIGPPAAADFDGDGRVELAVPAGSLLHLVEVDGTVRWSAPVADPGGHAGCSGFDFDADGAYEVVYADADDLVILAGTDGRRLLTWTDHASSTRVEFPVVADVDGDGAAELVLASNQTGFEGVTVLGHATTGWPEVGSDWPTHDYAGTNVLPDGSVPGHPAPSWQRGNRFRARAHADSPPAADLTVSLTETCLVDCTWGPARVHVLVSNLGRADVPAGARLELVVPGPVELGVGVVELPAIPAGSQLGELAIDVPVELLGPGGLRVVVDPDPLGVGDVVECDEGNNVVLDFAFACP